MTIPRDPSPVSDLPFLKMNIYDVKDVFNDLGEKEGVLVRTKPLPTSFNQSTISKAPTEK